jgi:hypothetical protein
MKTILLISAFAVSFGASLAGELAFPTQAGEYSHKGWKYTYEVSLKGTRSERRIGRLYLNGKEVKGQIGELHQEPIGTFIYFGDEGYNQGWLNTMTYDASVFADDGAPTPEVTKLLKVLRDKQNNKQNKPDMATPRKPSD